MKRFLKWIFALSVMIIVVAVLVGAFLRGRQEAASEAEQENPPEAPSRVGAENGQTFITLDASTQSRNGIETRGLAATTQRQESRANAVVLSAQNLAEMRASYLSAAAQVEKAKAALDVSQGAYARVKQLYDDNQNASAKAVQEAEGAQRSDQTSFRAATEALQLNETQVRQMWGDVISQWLIAGSPAFDRILARKDLLLQVSFLSGAVAVPPETAAIQSPSGKIQRAEFVSAYSSVDPRIQSASFLYLTPSTSEFVPGMTLVALLPTGPLARGGVVPAHAVVWWQGKAWAYVQIAPERFARREVSTDTPVSNGWFVSSRFSPGEKVVIQGAQQLLSEEFRSQIQVLSDSE
jgi:hypothetical protein